MLVGLVRLWAAILVIRRETRVWIWAVISRVLLMTLLVTLLMVMLGPLLVVDALDSARPDVSGAHLMGGLGSHLLVDGSGDCRK